MTPKALTLSKYIARASVVFVVAMGASACSSVPDWVDPTTWVGDSDTDQTAAPADQGQQTADNNTQTPDLSTIPDRPQPTSTADERQQVADSLAADRSKAQYSADALRGGTEPAAAPPPAEAAPSGEEVAANDNTAAPAQPAAPPAPPPPPAAGPGTLPADNSAPAPAEAAPAPAPAASPAVASEAMPPPQAAPAVSSSAPAVPAVGPTQQVASSQIAGSDASLGFRPSSAPPLDASVAQFVPPSIMARYQQTASIGGGAPAVPATGTAYASNSRHMGVGGPEKMSGAVVANFDSLQGGAVSPSAFVGSGTAAVVFFVHDTTVLDNDAKAQVREAAKAFLARGGQGYVRVVGHATSTGSSMSSERQLVWNFERSQARANAVARALIAQGVPADKVLVQAVGDDGSGYGVTAPAGGDGGRRADIIFES